MKAFKHLIFIIFFLFLQSQLTFSQQNIPLANWMEANGFENIEYFQKGDTLLLSYENRIFRHEADAIAYLLKKMPLPETGEIIMLPKYLNSCMLQLSINLYQIHQYRKKEIKFDDFINTIIFSLNTDRYGTLIHNNKLRNSSFFKADISLEPILSMQLGNYDRPIQALAEIAPNLQIQLARGLVFNAQLLIPIYNNLKSMEDVSIRAGIITLSQNLRLPDDFLITATAGKFSYDRLGIDLKTKKYFFEGRLAVYTQMGYSGWTEISDTYVSRYYDQDNYFIGRIGTEYRLAKYDLLLSASYGTFLYQDKGWRFDILRQFGETIIGFSGVLTSETYNAGFYLSIPLLPKKYAKLNKVRIRPSHSLRWGYNFRGQTYAGKNYSTGTNIINKSKEFNPFFIKNQLIQILTNSN